METAPQVPTWLAVGVALAAVYAAILSTVQFVRSLRDERPRIRVDMSLGRVLNVPGERDDGVKLIMTYINVGRIPVTIPGMPVLLFHHVKDSKFSLPYRATKQAPPYRLEPFSHNTAWASLDALAKQVDFGGLDKGAEYWIVAEVTDAAGRRHRSVPHALFRRKRRLREIDV